MNEFALRWFAPAKLNLFLHVLGRRNDGYHQLQTLFQLLDEGDTLQEEITQRISHNKALRTPQLEDMRNPLKTNSSLSFAFEHASSIPRLILALSS